MFSGLVEASFKPAFSRLKRNYPFVCDLLKATRCAARFFFFLALKTSARLPATRSPEPPFLGFVSVFVGVAVGSAISTTSAIASD